MIKEKLVEWKQAIVTIIIITLASTVPVRQTQWGLLTTYELLRHLVWEKIYIFILSH